MALIQTSVLYNTATIEFSIFAQEVFTDDPDGIGTWLESKLRVGALLLLIVVIIKALWNQASGKQGGNARLIGGAVLLAALALRPALLLEAGDIAAELFSKTLKTFGIG